MKHKDLDEKQDHIKQDKVLKIITIIVNGQQEDVEKGELTFDEIVALAFDNPATGENVLFTISYFKGHGNKPEGSLVQGDVVKVKEGMVFNVSQTDKS
ncbi:multiubiquitin domain-containing protein [Desulfuromonas acetoxidans]|uniref:multiubiquitin domain-containing protein n=1 Tax=Desulfuromonas acetoxidans TaxID=891 RepID=UPI00292DF27D|nr:multiubiquitin domain-containing protein [Desulfuromonas acetoxidans]